MSVFRPIRIRSHPVPRLLAFMLIAAGLALASVGLAAVAETTPTAQAQVATLGTPPPSPLASTTPTPELNAEDSLIAYAACMREHGIETDDPQFDVNGNLVSKPAFKAALKSGEGDETFATAQADCGDYLVAMKPALDPALQAEQTEAALRFAACMRDQGLDWPDPAADGSKFAGSGINIDKQSPEFQAAFEVCGGELAVKDASGAGQ
jgi:hypothetical protein